MKPSWIKTAKLQANGSHPFKNNLPFNFSPDKKVLKKHLSPDSGNGHCNGNGSLLRALRENKGLSQRELAEKCGIPRTSLQRLEEMSQRAITLGELELLSKGLDLKVEELFHRFNGFEKNGFVRLNEKSPCFVLNYGEGIEYASDLHKPEDCFIGTLTLAPQKTITKEDAPRGELVFFEVRRGLLTMTQAGKARVFKPGERFYLKEPQPYELYNPHQFEKLVVTLITLPSFIHSLP